MADVYEELPLVLFLEDIVSPKLLRCSVRTGERMYRSGQLPEPLPLPGRRKRWSRDSIVAWLNGGMAPARRRRSS